MAFFEKNKDKIWSKYTLKRTKLHSFKKTSRGSMPPNPPSNSDMQIPKSEEKKFLAPPPPPQILGTPLLCIVCNNCRMLSPLRIISPSDLKQVLEPIPI